MAKRRSRGKGIHPLIVVLLAVIAAAGAGAWTYASWIRTKYEGSHPYWSRETFRALDQNSLEYKAAEKLLKPSTLDFFREKQEAAAFTGQPLSAAQPLEEEETRKEIHIEHVSAGTYEGFMIVVPDPKDVSMVVNPGYGTGAPGQKLDWYVEKYHALAGTNAGGFADDGGNGDGSVPNGLVIQNGKVIHGGGGYRSHMVGFDKNGNLVAGKLNDAEALAKGVVEAVTFGPTLITDGRVVYTSADAGTLNMLNPRTAIGQKKDGTVLILVVDGRGPTSFGAHFEDLVDIFKDYEAVNASNLDGGNSSVMIYDGEYANYPVSMKNSRALPSVILVKGDQ